MPAVAEAPGGQAVRTQAQSGLWVGYDCIGHTPTPHPHPAVSGVSPVATSGKVNWGMFSAVEISFNLLSIWLQWGSTCSLQHNF